MEDLKKRVKEEEEREKGRKLEGELKEYRGNKKKQNNAFYY